MDSSLFKLTSLNLNGIRSASTKGVEAWIEATAPDCICVQEIKAQAADMTGRFELLAGLRGHFHYAEKKGYSGVGVYSRHEPSDVVVGFGSHEFDAEGRYVEARFDTPARKLSIISAYFPSGSSGELRQTAKFRFLAEMHEHLMRMKGEREFILCGDINIAHQQIDLKNWRSNQKNSGFTPEEREWMTKLLHKTDPTGGLSPAPARHHGHLLHMVEQPRPGLCQQRGMAPGLPPGHPGHRRTGTHRAHLQGCEVLGPCAGDHRL